MAMTQEQEQKRAQWLVDYYRICFAHPAVHGILMWGFWEGANWLPQSSLYKHDWTPTPAAKAYRDLVFGQWWTNREVVTDEEGRVEIAAFFGLYSLTAGDSTVTVNFNKAGGRRLVTLPSDGD
jgi:hypothetical protein